VSADTSFFVSGGSSASIASRATSLCLLDVHPRDDDAMRWTADAARELGSGMGKPLPSLPATCNEDNFALCADRRDVADRVQRDVAAALLQQTMDLIFSISSHIEP
jgi:hypothetical protein